jgi:hypothetical protein
MTTQLILIHVFFIVALVVSVWYSGFKRGRADMMTQMMEDGLLTGQSLIDFYNINKDNDKTI